VKLGSGGATSLKKLFRGVTAGEGSREGVMLKVFDRARRLGVDFAWRRREKEGRERRDGRGGVIVGVGSWEGRRLGKSAS